MDNVNKTLYIPLCGKAYVSRKGLLLRDKTAEMIWDEAGITLKGKAASKWLAYNMGMRAAVFDRWLTEKMEQFHDAVILHIGCGLDGRCSRVGTGTHIWFDVDFPEVIRERSRYFPETAEYRMLGSDVRQEGWMNGIPEGGRAIVVMEGVSMYLTGQELRELLKGISNRFDSAVLLMDTYTEFAARVTKFKNPINEVGVTQVYGFDDPAAAAENTGFRFEAEHSLTPETLIAELPKKEQRFFRTMFTGKTAKKIYRLYEYTAKIRES